MGGNYIGLERLGEFRLLSKKKTEENKVLGLG